MEFTKEKLNALKALTNDERKAILDATPKADFIETFQENIRSRKQGRRIGALNAVLSMSREERDEAFKIEKKMFNEKLEKIDDEHDPLSIYVDYAEWLVEMTPDGYGGPELETVLFDATNKFPTDPQYKDDVRYLKLCIEYSKWLEEPKDLFLFLIKNKIGQNSGLFYEEYASLLESSNKHEEAIEVYKIGIERVTRCAGRLEKKLESLKLRVVERIKRGIIRENEAKKQQELMKKNGRTMLGHKFDSSSRYSVPSNVYAGIQAAHGALNRASFGNDVRSSTKAEPKIAVYRDEPSSSLTSLTSKISKNDSTSHIFKPTRSKVDKAENRLTSADYKGVTIPQAKTRQPVEKPFVVYKDYMEPSMKRSPVRRDSSSIKGSSSEDVYVPQGSPTSHSKTSQTRIKMKDKHEADQVDHFKRNQSKYFLSKNTKGGLEIITVLKTIHEQSCIEEERIHYKGIKYEKQETNSGAEFELYTKAQNITTADVGYTTETKKAKSLVDQKLFEQDSEPDEHDDVTWNSPFERIPVKRKQISNENE